MRRIGLTGGIASGKSLVQTFLQGLEVSVLDTDAVTHDLLATDGELQARIREAFGDGVFLEDREGVDRRALGAIVFADAERRKRLESWIHPKVRLTMDRFFQTCSEAGHILAVAAVPLLFESNLSARFDEVWLVVATAEQQLARLMASRGFTEAEALARLSSQMPLEEKILRADRLIENTGLPDVTERQVRALVEGIRQSTQEAI